MASGRNPLSSATRLRAAGRDGGKKGMVRANVRLLIDKLLARYSTDFFVCRELIQNADDAKATCFLFEIECQDSNDVSNNKNGNIRRRLSIKIGKEFFVLIE